MSMRSLIVVLLCTFFGVFQARASLTCQKVFQATSTQTPTIDAFNQEIDALEEDLYTYRSIMELNSQIESLKNRRGAHVRETREAREKMIHQWRMSIRTGDPHRVVEKLRHLYDVVLGEARILHTSRLLHMDFGNLVKNKLIGQEEAFHIETELTSLMDQSIEVLGDHYSDFSAADWVITEMTENGELERILHSRGLKLEEFLAQVQTRGLQASIEDLNTVADKGAEGEGEGLSPTQVSPQSVVTAYNRLQALSALQAELRGMLPPNSISSNLMPYLFNTEARIDRQFVKEVFGAAPTLYTQGRNRVYRPEAPLTVLLTHDLEAETRSYWVQTLVAPISGLTDFLITKVDLIPGGGFRIRPDSHKVGVFTWLTDRLGQISEAGRLLLYQFIKGVLDQRAIDQHLSDIETLHKIREARGTEAFVVAARDIAARHGERQFYTSFSRIPFYSSDFMAFKQGLTQSVAELKGKGILPTSLERSLELANEGELLGTQIGTLNVLVEHSQVQIWIQRIGFTASVPLVVNEAYHVVSEFLDRSLGVDLPNSIGLIQDSLRGLFGL